MATGQRHLDRFARTGCSNGAWVIGAAAPRTATLETVPPSAPISFLRPSRESYSAWLVSLRTSRSKSSLLPARFHLCRSSRRSESPLLRQPKRRSGCPVTHQYKQRSSRPSAAHDLLHLDKLRRTS